MKRHPELKKRLIAVANKEELADLVIKNGRVIDVFTKDIFPADVAIVDGVIAAIGSYEGKETVDAAGMYVSPSFIDGHVHIESSMVTPVEFAKVVLPHGVTTVITDPHEIANVSGVNGLGEVMDFPAVRDRDHDMMRKLEVTERSGKVIDGHASGFLGDDINIYRAANILTDHECTTAEEALDRLRRGMYVIIREGSVAKNLHALLPLVTEKNANRFLFCTDDKHLDELITEGSIDYNVREAIKFGVDPAVAISIASLHAAECYQLLNKGAVAPGYDADLLLVSDLQELAIESVWKNGTKIVEKGRLVEQLLPATTVPEQLVDTVHIEPITRQQLELPMKTEKAHIIGIQPNSLLTTHLVEKVHVENGRFVPSIEADQLKLAVIERHQATRKIGLGIVKGFGITRGAIAATVAHDSHNLIVAGTNDDDMLTAIDTLQACGGGLTVVQNCAALAVLPLQISGLMSVKSFHEVNEEIQQLNQALRTIGADQSFNPFVTLSFLALPVIPSLKLTNRGLFDVTSFAHIDIHA